MPQKKQQQQHVIGLARKPAQLIIQALTPSKAHKLLKHSRELFVKDPDDGFKFGEGVYDAGKGRLYLLEHWVMGWEEFIRPVSDAEAFSWYAANDHEGTDLSSDQDARNEFQERIAATLNQAFCT